MKVCGRVFACSHPGSAVDGSTPLGSCWGHLWSPEQWRMQRPSRGAANLKAKCCSFPATPTGLCMADIASLQSWPALDGALSAGSRPAAAERVCVKGLPRDIWLSWSQVSLLHHVSSHLTAAEDPGSLHVLGPVLAVWFLWIMLWEWFAAQRMEEFQEQSPWNVSESLLYDFGVHLEGRCVYPWYWWSTALADGVGKEEMARTAAGFAWQVWPPLSSVCVIKFPKGFWASQEEWNPCSSLFSWAGGRELFEAARQCEVALLEILKPPSAYGLSSTFLEITIWWCCRL